ncbi:RNA-binding domain-containing protein [Nadsonia fulvescens var. elongata DSM 6958]|uniref:Nucleolar protein 12 n=1 Tax=Nadsonia fulvescens var. elongata DSM 6958 TaxID=857566 RepID=A0A1E3PMT1_9ASCO|nr:RNA-binding domain-containing protein [Nadsonia fulvescens var. elongata DSM 6958]
MSLFGNIASVDSSLDNLFKNSSGPVQRPQRKRRNDDGSAELELDELATLEGASDYENNSDDEEEVEIEVEEATEVKQQLKKKKKQQEDEGLEGRYLNRLLEEQTKEAEKEEKKKDSEEPTADAENTTEPTEETVKEDLTHESISNPDKEVDKAERTIFVGNISSSTITKKADYASLKALFAVFGKIESVRFRSISFSEILPRKVAFVKHKFHSERDTVNAYIVYSSKDSIRKALKLNSTVFLKNHIRVDSVAHPAKHDNKRSVFIGNLSFEAKEEPLWEYFGKCGDIEFVRIIRDSKTNVGKGFAYVQFQDTNGVAKALLLNKKKMPSGRELRVTRCKNIKKPSSSLPGSNKPFKVENKKLTDEEKTRLGRAHKMVGKAAKSQISNAVEGVRATKGDSVPGLKIGSSGKKKNKPRIRARSTEFKKNAKNKKD